MLPAPATGPQSLSLRFRGIKLLNGLNNCGNGCLFFMALSIPTRHTVLKIVLLWLKCESQTQSPDLSDQKSSNKTAVVHLLPWGERWECHTEGLFADRAAPRPICYFSLPCLSCNYYSIIFDAVIIIIIMLFYLSEERKCFFAYKKNWETWWHQGDLDLMKEVANCSELK